MRTETEARARAEENRRQREQQRLESGEPVELISDYVKVNLGRSRYRLASVRSTRSTRTLSASR
jgi:hypothetical protein